MDYKFQYITDEEKTTIISNNSDKILVEVQDITEGKFLIFSDTARPVVPIQSPVVNSDLTALQQQNLDIMQGMADIYTKISGGTV